MSDLTVTAHANVPIARLSGFYFFYFALLGAYLPYWSLYLESLGFAKAQIGVLSAIGLVSRVIAPSVWGYLADKTGKRMLLVKLSASAQLCAWIAIFFAPKLFMPLAIILFVSSFFQNAILAQFEAATLFWLNGRREDYGRVRLWGSLGFAAAVVGLGFYFDYFEIYHLTLILIAISAVAVCNAYLIAEPPKVVHHAPSMPIGDVLKRPVVAGFFVVALLVLLSHAPFYTFYSNYLESYGYSKKTIGLLWGVGIAAEVIMFMHVQKVLDRYSERVLIVFSVAVTALRWLIVALLPQFFVLQFTAQLIHAFSFALFHTLAMRLIVREFSPAQQGSAQGIYNTVWGVGVALGSLVAGHVWNTITGQGVFLCASMICLLGLLVVYISAQPRRYEQ